MPRKAPSAPVPPARFAALSITLGADGRAPTEIMLLPAGRFRATDGSGRPQDVPAGWRMDAAAAARLIAQIGARGADTVIDYEHQTLVAQTAGVPAPAAGWFSRLEWREGSGLWATDVRWTDRAAAMIAASEYRYLSPVFTYDPDGTPNRLFPVALTNNPGLGALPELSAALTALIAQHTEFPDMDLLASLVAALGLPAGTAEATALTAVTALKTKHDELATRVAALTGEKTTLEGQVAALTAAGPDPAKYVPVAAVTELQGQLAALTAQVTGGEVDKLVADAMAAGKIPPALEAWARDLGKKDVAALRAYIGAAAPVVVPGQTQTGGKKPEGGRAAQLDAGELAVCTAMGLDPADFAKAKA
ncbi:phage protease [Methyloversatilis universalis]|nr:phage protease [Methyloversatilis universalis]